MSDFPEIGRLAVIGDARTTAVIGPDGAVELLCLPRLDGQIVLGRLLDRNAGVFELRPLEAASADLRYARNSNVTVTRWQSQTGVALVMDGLIGGPGGEAASSTLVRQIRCLSGRMRFGHRLVPRFQDGLTPPDAVQPVERGHRVDGHGLTLAFGADHTVWEDGAFCGEHELRAGEEAVLTFGVGAEPITAQDARLFLETTLRAWRAWAASLHCEGRWAEAILRSALALRLLIRDTSGAIAAAGTLGLPEHPGGQRNYDYRYCWLRDASFVVDALASVGARESARRFLDWLGRALHSSSPRLQPFYRLDGDRRAQERESALSGYQDSAPVRIGNRAYRQLQLGSAGDMLQSCALLLRHQIELPGPLRRGIPTAVDHLVDVWQEPDHGIWEVQPPRQHTWSKMSAWIAFTRAAELREQGLIEGDARAWSEAAKQVRDRIERDHFSSAQNTYVAAAGEDGLDAAVLLGVFMGYEPSSPDRWHGTLAAIDRELSVGPYVYRTSQLRDQEMTFLPCAFWRAHALVRLERLDEARSLLDQLIGAVGSLGLFSEEAGPDGSAWGNIPQALTHAALINACLTYEERAAAG